MKFYNSRAYLDLHGNKSIWRHGYDLTWVVVTASVAHVTPSGLPYIDSGASAIVKSINNIDSQNTVTSSCNWQQKTAISQLDLMSY